VDGRAISEDGRGPADRRAREEEGGQLVRAKEPCPLCGNLIMSGNQGARHWVRHFNRAHRLHNMDTPLPEWLHRLWGRCTECGRVSTARLLMCQHCGLYAMEPIGSEDRDGTYLPRHPRVGVGARQTEQTDISASAEGEPGARSEEDRPGPAGQFTASGTGLPAHDAGPGPAEDSQSITAGGEQVGTGVAGDLGEPALPSDSDPNGEDSGAHDTARRATRSTIRAPEGLEDAGAQAGSEEQGYGTRNHDPAGAQEPTQEPTQHAPRRMDNIQLGPCPMSLDWETLDFVDKAFQTTSSTTIPVVPKAAAKEWARALMECIVEYAVRKDTRTLARLMLLPRATLAPLPRGGRAHQAQRAREVLERLEAWKRGRPVWPARYPATRRKANRGADEGRAQKRAVTLARAGEYGRAAAALTAAPLAPMGTETAERLQALHPFPRHEWDTHPARAEREDVQAGRKSPDVSAILRQFPKGSAPGPSGLRAEHLKQALENIDAADHGLLLEALSAVVELIAEAKLPSNHASRWCGGSLVALSKKGGAGVRPICVGEVLRRAAGRHLCAIVKDKASKFFLDHQQVGVGTRDGITASVWAARLRLEEEGVGMVKLDFTNAFNSASRQVIRRRTAKHFQELVPFVEWGYGQAAPLHFGEELLYSREGVQQGDPLSPLLFSLAIVDLMEEAPEQCRACTTWYLDDAVAIADANTLVQLVEYVATYGAERGLQLNEGKCEYLHCEGWEVPERLRGFRRLRGVHGPPGAARADLLGVPLVGDPGAFKDSIGELKDRAADLLNRLPGLQDAQVAYHLLRACAGAVRMNHCLRTLPWGIPGVDEALSEYDMQVFGALHAIIGARIGTAARVMAAAPWREGGLGIRSAALEHEPQLRSAIDATKTLTRILADAPASVPLPGAPPHIISVEELTRANSVAATYAEAVRHITAGATPAHQAKLRSQSQPGATGWCRAQPGHPNVIPHKRAQVIIGWWIGAELLNAPFQCPCSAVGHTIGIHGLEALNCHGPDNYRRHNAVADVFAELMQIGDPGRIRKEVTPAREDRARPADVWHENWLNEEPAAFDVSVINPSRSDTQLMAAERPLYAAHKRHTEKIQKYGAHARRAGFCFVPLVYETSGASTAQTYAVLQEAASRAARRTAQDTVWVTLQWAQRVSVALMCGNAGFLLNLTNRIAGLPVDTWRVGEGSRGTRGEQAESRRAGEGGRQACGEAPGRGVRREGPRHLTVGDIGNAPGPGAWGSALRGEPVHAARRGVSHPVAALVHMRGKPNAQISDRLVAGRYDGTLAGVAHLSGGPRETSPPRRRPFEVEGESSAEDRNHGGAPDQSRGSNDPLSEWPRHIPRPSGSPQEAWLPRGRPARRAEDSAGESSGSGGVLDQQRWRNESQGTLQSQERRGGLLNRGGEWLAGVWERMRWQGGPWAPQERGGRGELDVTQASNSEGQGGESRRGRERAGDQQQRPAAPPAARGRGNWWLGT
jgi:hypothetical protein